MTRIVSGFAGSLTLSVPRSGTRPTSDRVREAVFSALDARDEVDGAYVADLFAGSGALGLEAASRGAASVVLVEKAAQAVAVCRRNADAVLRAVPHGESVRISVHPGGVLPFLQADGVAFDIVFIDPPYELDEAELARVLEALVPRLTPDATIVVERSSRSPQPTLPDGLVLEREKRYGETTLWWLTTADQPAAPSQPE